MAGTAIDSGGSGGGKVGNTKFNKGARGPLVYIVRADVAEALAAKNKSLMPLIGDNLGRLYVNDSQIPDIVEALGAIGATNTLLATLTKGTKILNAVKVKEKIAHYYLDTATVISWTIEPGVPFRLWSLDIHASAVLDTGEVLTITKDADRGTSHDTLLLSDDLFIGSRISEHYVFGKGYEFPAKDKLIVAQANGSPDTIGIDVTIEIL